MASLDWTYQQLVDYYFNHPSVDKGDPNPIIQRLLAAIPDARVHSIGGHSVVLRLSSDIVAKVSMEHGDDRLCQEQTVFEALRNIECPNIIQCYLFAPDVCFQELVLGGTLYDRIPMAKPRPITHWMLQLTQAAACLETLGYAHGDINPRNIMFDEDDNVRLIDFDHACTIGDRLDVGQEPYVRQNYGSQGGQFGLANAAGEQFALGSIFWFFTRGTEAYSDISGSDRVNRMMDGIFPVIDLDDPIDVIINNCWHHRYPTIADLLRDVQQLSGLDGHKLSELQGQTPSPMTVDRKREQRLRCEDYCAMVGLVPMRHATAKEDMSDEVKGGWLPAPAVTMGASLTPWQHLVHLLTITLSLTPWQHLVHRLTSMVPLAWRRKALT